MKVKGFLKGEAIELLDQNVINDLNQKGYGERTGDKLVLKPYEALYLVDTKKISISVNDKELSVNDLVNLIKKIDKRGWTKYLIYRDLRNKGYVVKEGFGKGLDFRVYERGEYGEKPAKYVIIALNEGGRIRLEKLRKSVDLSLKMGKEPILAVVDRRGEVVYYKAFKVMMKL